MIKCKTCGCDIHACDCKQDEMTPTKEEQILAGYKKWVDDMPEMPPTYLETWQSSWKICAESYEKKLAEAIARITDVDSRALSNALDAVKDANTRNAKLVEILIYLKSHLVSGDYEAHNIIDAAWEAEKLEPLRREVAMLTAIVKDASQEYKKLPHSLGYTITHAQRWDMAINSTQATAEAYEREVKAEALEKAANWEWTGIQKLDDRAFVKSELHDAANKVKGE